MPKRLNITNQVEISPMLIRIHHDGVTHILQAPSFPTAFAIACRRPQVLKHLVDDEYCIDAQFLANAFQSISNYGINTLEFLITRLS